MQNATTKQISCIHALFHRLQLSEDSRHTIIQAYSATQSTSSKDLTLQEALQVIQYLNAQLPDERDKGPMQRKIFYYCHEMGWTKRNNAGKIVADGKRFDDWARKYSYLQKALNRYTYAEMPKLVTQFENVYKAYLKKF